MKFIKTLPISLSLILLFSVFAFGEMRNTDESCDSLKASVKSGAEPMSALRAILLTKPEFCPIIRCALEIGIPIKTIYHAARSSACPDCIVARCTMSTCRQTERLLETDDVCKTIKEEVEKGKDAATLVLEKLRQGYQACTVLRCAVAAGSDLEGVIRAARDANVSDDIISRCCVDGCADPYRVAEILHEYDKPRPPIDPKKPGYLSPSGF